MSEDKRRERLRFRSWHRGTREMDLLLGSFADAHLHAFTDAQLETYEALLEQSDPDIYNWMTGREPVPADVKSDVTDKLCAHRFAGKEAS
ncbi:MAG TPA: succinate dehydrogenase assembly factor 2 [Alphaproteobacteria bacterium]|nr:succinate dehydrogenase assembly factor 2 [Alphaproteobacteria bacterium]